MCGLDMNMKTCFSMVLWETTGFRVQGSGWKSHFCSHHGPLSGWLTSGGLLPAVTQGCPLPPFGMLYRWNERQGFLSVCPSIYFQKRVMVCDEGNIHSKPYYKKKRSNSLWKKDETERSISILSADWVTGKCLEVLMREGKHSGYVWCLVLLPKGNQVISHPHLKMAFWFVFWKPTRHMYQVKTGGLLPLSSICPNETIPEIKSYIRIAQLLSKIQ